MLHVFQQRFDRRKAGARGQQHHGFVAVFAQVKAAERRFYALNFFFFHGAEHMVGEFATRHVPYMQIDDRGACNQCVRRIRDRVGTARTVAQ